MDRASRPARRRMPRMREPEPANQPTPRTTAPLASPVPQVVAATLAEPGVRIVLGAARQTQLGCGLGGCGTFLNVCLSTRGASLVRLAWRTGQGSHHILSNVCAPD